jgi:hypothetical protein
VKPVDFFAGFVFCLARNVRILDSACSVEERSRAEQRETRAARTENPAIFTLAQRLLNPPTAVCKKQLVNLNVLI